MYAAELARIQGLERDLKRRLALAHRGVERWLLPDRSWAWRSLRFAALRARMRDAILASGKQAYARGWNFDAPRRFAVGSVVGINYEAGVDMPPEWARWYESTVDDALRRYTDRVQHEVSRIVTQGAADGSTVREMTEQVRSMVDGMETWQAERIARTETMRLWNLGHFARMESEGPELLGYEYSVVLDDRTSHICRPIAGKKVPRGAHVRVPPLHPHCRTILLPLYSYDDGVTNGEPEGGWAPHAVVDATPGFGAVPRMPAGLMQQGVGTLAANVATTRRSAGIGTLAPGPSLPGEDKASEAAEAPVAGLLKSMEEAALWARQSGLSASISTEPLATGRAYATEAERLDVLNRVSLEWERLQQQYGVAEGYRLAQLHIAYDDRGWAHIGGPAPHMSVVRQITESEWKPMAQRERRLHRPDSVQRYDTWIEDNFRHELGHVLSTPVVLSRFITDVLSKYDLQWMGYHVSEYAGTGIAEALAECFSIYTRLDYGSRRLPKAIEAFFAAMMEY